MRRIKKAGKIILGIKLALAMCYIMGYCFAINSQAYHESLIFINFNEVINENIGIDEETKLAFWNYSITYHNSVWKAKFKIHVKGNIGTGALHIELEKKEKRWDIQHSVLYCENGQIYNLLEKKITS